MPAQRVLAELRGKPWVIQSEWLAKMIAIAEGTNLQELEALESKQGKSLEYSREMTVRGSVAVIPIEGPIFPKANLMTEHSGATSLSAVALDFQAALDDDSIEKIVLKANSPGGSATDIDEMAALIRGSSKPTFTHISGVGASAMYWLASATDVISISPTSAVGSIGVAFTTRKSSPEEEDSTIEFVSSVSPRKRLNPESDEGEEQIMSLVNSMAEVFVSDVALGRNTSPEDVQQNFGKGGMVIAKDALEVGMVDRIGTFEELMADLSGQSTSFNGDYQMDIKELKAKHPDVYQVVFDAGVTSADESHTVVLATLQEENGNLKAANDTLTQQVEEGAEAAKKNEDRILTLEKNDAIRQQKAVKDQAEGIANTAVAASDIPEQLHKKVKAGMGHGDFLTDDGELDVKAYSAKVSEEVNDWTTSLDIKKSPLNGFGSGGAEASENNEEESDQLVGQLLSHVQPS